MNDQLKACPFCGGQANIIEAEDVDGRFAAVGCSKCGCGSRQHYFLGDDARQQVTSAWNTRAQAEDGAAVRLPVPFSIDTRHKNEGFVTLGFSDRETRDRFIKAIQSHHTPLYTHPPRAQEAGEDARDAARYNYLLDCEVIAAREYLPNLDADAFKASRRAKHDSAIAALSAQRGEAES
ncbi:restriction alleviation protein, Lar family [Dyella jiangningensis]|uniref:Lar family restriction alleviation protein n=1 Tax=Dyella sp. AtDHG13 TaxID=1938897 RepID=UPI00088A1BA2|nr:Lar family restriction alleviation protein [Dyella sp. AtDHG13]PXV60703.1 Lar family restriction alleviation protein [Dyella sp. AtDHG13]SDJ55785.1 restriction alleviation protein, Lar family [Dyella jiangningensis]